MSMRRLELDLFVTSWCCATGKRHLKKSSTSLSRNRVVPHIDRGSRWHIHNMLGVPSFDSQTSTGDNSSATCWVQIDMERLLE